MPGSTPRGYTYPSEPDQAAGDLNIQSLAEAVDTDMTASSVPTGSIIAYGGSAAPTGWHLCDGTAHGSSALQTVIGSASAPDLRDKFILSAGSTYAAATTGGAAEVTLTAAQMPAHTHTGPSHTHSTPNHSHDVVFDNGVNFLRLAATDGSTANRFILAEGSGTGMKTANSGGGTSGAAGTGNTGSAGSGSAHNNMPPYYALTYIIKL